MINNNTQEEFRNHPVKISLNSSNFEFFKSFGEGDDIRLTDGDGITSLDFWIELWEEGKADIWINIPFLDKDSSKIVYIYYGNETALSESNGKNIFLFYDGFDEFSPIAVNSPQPLVTPTYDGSGQAVHPDVIYIPEGWNGFKYWMAITPFAFNDDAYENPSVVVSNNGIDWQDPPGLINPLVPRPTPPGYNNDNDFLLINNNLVLYFNETNNDGNTYVKRMSSVNGINWSAPQIVFFTPQHLMSPTVLFEDNTYYMWYVRTDSNGCYSGNTDIFLRESVDGINWGPEQPVNLELDNQVIWHMDIYKNGFDYEMLVANYPKSSSTCSRTQLYRASSQNKFDWIVDDLPLITPVIEGWDDYNIYRASLVVIDSLYRVWYSSRSSRLTWNIGYTEGTLKDFYKGWNNVKGNFTLNSEIKRNSGSSLENFTQNPQSHLKKNISGHVSINTWIYDDGTSGSGNSLLLSLVDVYKNSIGFGIFSSVSLNKYVYVNQNLEKKISSVSRSLGWHKFTANIENSSCTLYIDDQLVATLEDLDEENITRFTVNDSGTQHFYLDDVYIKKSFPVNAEILVADSDTEFENFAPILRFSIADQSYFEDSGPYTVIENLDSMFYDSSGDSSLVYDMSSSNDSVSTLILDNTLTLETVENYFGNFEIIVKATDPFNLWTADTFSVNILPVNDWPTLTFQSDTLIIQGDSVFTINMWDISSDVESPDEELNYSFTTSNDTLSADYNPVDGILTLNLKEKFMGTIELIATVTDDSSGFSSDSLTIVADNITGIKSREVASINNYMLYQNYPNPFNPSTLIQYDVAFEGMVKLDVYNSLGELVTVLFNGIQKKGIYSINFNGSNLPSGVYYFSINISATEIGRDFRSVKKALLIK